MSHFKILLVEDNPHDVELIQWALKESEFSHKLVVKTDGEAALKYLRRKNTSPDLVILDLNLPKLPGLEVLKEIRQGERTTTLPVVILTNSNSTEDVRLAYKNGCNSYVRKPVGFDVLQEALTSVLHFWFHTSTLPPRMSLPPGR